MQVFQRKKSKDLLRFDKSMNLKIGHDLHDPYRLNKTFIHFCNQLGNFVCTYSRLSTCFKLK